MRSFVFGFAVFTLSILMLAPAANGQYSRLVVNDSTAKRLGMEIMWRTQVQIGSYSKLQNVTQVFGKVKKLVKYVVSYKDVVEEFFEDDVDRFGRKIGVDGAKARAEAKLKRYQAIGFDSAKLERVVEDPDILAKLQSDLVQKYSTASGFEKGKLENEIRSVIARRSRLLPEIKFLAQTNTSMLQSIDGRTGKTLWTQQIGLRNHPCMPVVAKYDHFAVVNGSTVYCGLLENGRVVWDRECRGAPGSRSAMTRNSVFVPMVNGFMEQFPIRSGTAATGEISSIGHSLLGATSSDTVVAWPSDRGELNVAFDAIDLKNVSYRLIPKKRIVSNAFFQAPYMFATSTDGSLYCLQQSSGKLVWEYPTGIPISRSPMAVGEFVYFVDDQDQLTQVSIATGLSTWTRQRVSKTICVSSKRVYCLNHQNHLVALDLKTGNLVGSLTQKPVEFVYQNPMTDRLLVGDSRGLIQCLREISQVEPIFHIQPEVAAESVEGAAKDATGDQQQPQNTDPFGGGAGGAKNNDPFGGGGAADDPFGGAGGGGAGGGGAKNNDPFGGGGAAKNDDDPFGN